MQIAYDFPFALLLKVVEYKFLVILVDFSFFFSFFALLGLELGAYTLSHSVRPLLYWIFLRKGLVKYLPRIASNLNPPELCLISS
jgi:hypothetical protein